MINALPDELAELLNDASPAADAATDQQVKAFIDEHQQATRPETLAGLTSALRNRFEAGESRHQSTATVTVGAMKEARLGLYPAQAAVDALAPMFLAAVAKPPISGKQGAARNGEVAQSEFNGILAWAVAQALAADLDDARTRIDQKMPEQVTEEDIPWPTEPPDDDWYHHNGANVGPETTKDRDEAADDDPGWTFIDGATFILDQPATIPTVWGHDNDVLWSEGESLMIAGPMGLGKTTLAILLMHAQLSLGDGVVLGLPVAPCPGKILYLAMDRPSQIARAARRLFTEAERQVLAERVLIWKGPPPADIAKNPGLLNALADKADAHTVYLDSVKDAAIGLSEDEVGAGYNRARQHLRAHGRQLAEQHHTTKRGASGGPPTSVADIYGSAWIANGTGSIILLSGEPGDPIVGFRHVRAPADEVGPWRLLHNQRDGRLTIEHFVNLVEVADAAGGKLTAKEGAVAVFETEKPTKAQIEKVRRRLNDLIPLGMFSRVEGTKGGGKKTPAVWLRPGVDSAPFVEPSLFEDAANG